MGTVRTRRLVLDPMAEEDAEALWPVFSDPAIWWYDPAGIHLDPGRTRAYCRSAASRWPADGLSYWTARLAAGGEVVGSGGVQVHATGEWNLNYRIASAPKAADTPPSWVAPRWSPPLNATPVVRSLRGSMGSTRRRGRSRPGWACSTAGYARRPWTTYPATPTPTARSTTPCGPGSDSAHPPRI